MSARLWLAVWLVLGLMASLPGVTAVGSSDYEAYVVQKDQTLAGIATDFGTTAEALAQFNKLESNAALVAGQVILVPASAGGNKAAPSPVAEPLPEKSPGKSPEKLPLLDTTPAAPKPLPADVVNGRVGSIIAAQIDIRSEIGRGRVLFSNAARGMSVLVIGESGAYDAILMADGGTGWLPKTAVLVTDVTLQVKRPGAVTTPISPQAQPLLDLAQEYLGIPYRYGGHLPRSVDCSLFVQTVFSRAGVKLPRTAAEQYAVGDAVEVEQLQPGDRLYFYDRAGNIGHTGIFLGGGRFIHASSNRGMVAIDELNNETYWKKYAGARR